MAERLRPTLIFVVGRRDRDATAQLVASTMTSYGWHVWNFHSAKACLNAVRNVRPVCIVADCELPGIDGIELKRMLRENEFDIPFVLMSNGLSNVEIEQARQLGISTILVKPFTIDAVKAAVCRLALQALPTMDTTDQNLFHLWEAPQPG
jgi:FixJ family two-component response regulator